MRIWNKYKKYIYDLNFQEGKTKEQDIEFWRTKLFSDLLIYLFPIGVLVYIPSLIMSVLSELYMVAIIDTITILIVFSVVIFKKISPTCRKLIIIISLYLLSVILLFYMGSLGPGLLYILAISTLTLLIINPKAGFISLYINIVLYVSILIIIHFQLFSLQFFREYSLGAWFAIGANFLLINLLMLITTNNLLKGLQKSLESESELKLQLEKELIALEEAKQKADEANKLKSAFMANISHEIRTPLNGIVGFSNLLAEGHVRQDRAKSIAKIIKKQNKLLLHIVNDILDLSKIESGLIDINKSYIVDCNKILEDIYETAIEDCPEGISFMLKTVENKAITILTDEYRLKQILINFVSNSFKYTKTGSVTLGAIEKPNCIEFFVEDTGIGLNQEQVSMIFNRFHKVDQNAPGPGLGLSICKSLAKLLGTEIYVESEPGQGSRFSVSLPLS